MNLMKIYIKKLKAKTIIGVNDFERYKKQKLYIDLEIDFELQQGFSDNIRETIDYDIVVKDVKNLVENSQFYTLERLCLEIIDFIFKNFDVNSVKVNITKSLNFKDCKSISVEETKIKNGRNFKKDS